MFTTTWVDARRAKDPNDVLTAVANQAPEPTSLRRLKRELLRGPNPLLSRSDPTLTLRSLTGETGYRILAEDADVDAWLDRAWKANRRAVLSLAAQSSADPDLQPEGGTAAEAAQFAAIALVLDRSIPSDLPLIALEAPDLAARSLSRHTETDWWDAWATLPQMDGALVTVATADAKVARSACNALLRQQDGTRLWSSLHRNNSAIAIHGLLAAVADTGQPMTSKWAAKLGPHGKEVVSEIHQGLPWRMLAAAADVAPYAADVARVPLHLWQPLAEHRQVWEGNPIRAAVLLTAALEAVGPAADELAADTFLVLHRAFSEGRADEAWRVIKPAIPGRLDDWDRCRFLEQGLAAAIVGNKRQQSRPGIRNRVPSGRARDALDSAVRSASAGVGKKDKPKGPLDDLFGFLRR